MIRCAYAEGRLRALIDGELPPAESRKVLDHVEQCASCRQEYARLQTVAALLQEQELEDVPAHFSANLQVRLARHRRERQAPKPLLARWLAALRQQSIPRRWNWAAGGLTTVAATAALCAVFISRGIDAAEIARRAELSWAQVQNYGCEFESTGMYQGQARSFYQKQFYRKNGDRPGEFRLDTSQDYPLTTYVSADRVVHYLPGGHWDDRGPLVIIRPRSDAQSAVPFPFGVTWQNGGNVSLDGLIRQLNQNHDAVTEGTESVGGRDCYRLAFSAPPSAGHPEDRYELWVDKESFLPRRVSWFRDAQNHIVTEARSLQVNYPVLPAGTFEFPMPAGGKVIHGDVEPHVFAMPFVPDRPAAFVTEPVESADVEAYRRSDSVAFPVLTPHYLPEGYQLVRVRRRIGRWVDVHWIRNDAAGVGHVVKLQEQDSAATPASPEGTAFNLGTSRDPMPATVQESRVPYPFVSMTWTQGKTRLTLSAADLSRAEVEKIARSMVEVTPPPQPIAVARRIRRAIEARGEPSILPTEPESTSATEVRDATSEGTSAPSGASVTAAPDAPPMMPDMADDEHRRTETTSKPAPAAPGRAVEPGVRHGVGLLIP